MTSLKQPLRSSDPDRMTPLDPLRTLARRRRELLAEALLAACAVAAFGVLVDHAAEAGLRGGAAVVAVAVAVGALGLRFGRRYADLIASACPRCGGLFFVSWERLVWSLPWLHRSCARCGAGSATPPPAEPH